jgi:hypothetical protein
MKLLFSSLAIASLALLALAGSAAIAATDPAAAVTRLDPASIVSPAAPEATACQLLIVEDREACVFTYVASTTCAPETMAMLQGAGARLLTTNAFLGECLLRPSASEAPS